MPWVPRRRYDPRYYYDPYRDRDWRRRRYDPGSSCLRDACLLETGCCVAESLDGNCLMAGLMLLPAFVAAAMHPSDAAGRGRPRRSTAAAMVSAVRLYQREISARRPAVCRYSPSCSEYAVQAIDGHGALRGALLAARRLLRCRPGGGRGADPVPA